MPDLLTTAEAAALLSLTDSRIRQLIRSGSLPARRLGRDWLIDREALKSAHSPAARLAQRYQP